MKRVASLSFVQWIIASFMYVAIWLVYYTSKKEFRGADYVRDFKGKPLIIIFWHSRSMMLSPIVVKFGFYGYAMASKHRDGQLMAKVQKLFGLKPIYGSSTEGGLDALKQGIRALREGETLCLTPDGPKGPRMRLSDSIFYFAKITGAPIVAVSYSGTRGNQMKRAWDRYLIAKPFSKLIYRALPPLFVDRSVSEEDIKKLHDKLEADMIKQMQDLDAECGLEKIEPAAVGAKRIRSL